MSCGWDGDGGHKKTLQREKKKSFSARIAFQPEYESSAAVSKEERREEMLQTEGTAYAQVLRWEGKNSEKGPPGGPGPESPLGGGELQAAGEP